MSIQDRDELPPFFKSWPQVYMSVIFVLLLTVLFLYWFSTLYS